MHANYCLEEVPIRHLASRRAVLAQWQHFFKRLANLRFAVLVHVGQNEFNLFALQRLDCVPLSNMNHAAASSYQTVHAHLPGLFRLNMDHTVTGVGLGVDAPTHLFSDAMRLLRGGWISSRALSENRNLYMPPNNYELQSKIRAGPVTQISRPVPSVPVVAS